jgi:succinate dehydrogenase / fumarate reductase, flavoprotein subunit
MDEGTARAARIAARVVIIGAGAAGLRTAIELASLGVDCLVLSRRPHGDAHTRMAAGGINAVLGSLDPDDRWDIHAADTLREGHFLCDPRAVEILAREAPDRVRELADWGCGFDRLDDGRINQRWFGAQSFRRTCFVGDVTGDAILRTLVRRAARLDVRWRDDVFITRILVHDGAAAGVEGFLTGSGEPVRMSARAVVLAAGGCTAIYRRHSSRDRENTGDAMALALDAGAALRDMEFIQFHPTGMIEPPAARGQLVTEAVRGEGGRLFNARGERFMQRYAPAQMELAARDVVARANAEEIRSGRGTPGGGVLLDISHRDADHIRQRLPRMVEQAAEQGIDLTRQPLQVAPTAHYPMGGVVVEPDTGATHVRGLFAVGEAASGVHGANRLGGNSLAETVVFGRRVGAHIAALLDEDALPEVPLPAPQATNPRAAGAPDADDPDAIAAALRDTMWEHAGIIRNADGLRAASRTIEQLRTRARSIRTEPASDMDAFMRTTELRFMLRTAEVIVRAALHREESRGAHFREDTPEMRDEWTRSIVLSCDGDGHMHERIAAIPPTPDVITRALDEHHTLEYHHLE